MPSLILQRASVSRPPGSGVTMTTTSWRTAWSWAASPSSVQSAAGPTMDVGEQARRADQARGARLRWEAGCCDGGAREERARAAL